MFLSFLLRKAVNGLHTEPMISSGAVRIPCSGRAEARAAAAVEHCTPSTEPGLGAGDTEDVST